MHHLQSSYLARRCALHFPYKVVKKLIIRRLTYSKHSLALKMFRLHSKNGFRLSVLYLKLQEFHNPLFPKRHLMHMTVHGFRSIAFLLVLKRKKCKEEEVRGCSVLFFCRHHCNSKTERGNRADVLV